MQKDILQKSTKVEMVTEQFRFLDVKENQMESIKLFCRNFPSHVIPYHFLIISERKIHENLPTSSLQWSLVRMQGNALFKNFLTFCNDRSTSVSFFASLFVSFFDFPCLFACFFFLNSSRFE